MSSREPARDGSAREIGLASPLARDRIRVAADFFSEYGINQDYLRGIDFAHDVREETLRPGFHLIGYRNGPIAGAGSWNPFGLFYAAAGTSAQAIAIRPDTRIYTQYIVAQAAPALRC